MIEKEAINKYLGVPYKHKGRDLSGLDCWGLIMCVYKDNGFEVSDFDIDYDENWQFKGENHFLENYHLQWEKIDLPKVFDVVLLFKDGVPNHAGIVLSHGKVLHTCRSGTVVSRLFTFKGKIEGYYRLK
jgi:cell wall-associated NlpC family hydrolase